MVVDRDTHARLAATCGPAAALVVPLLCDWIGPTSVVDLGCNVGVWLRAFTELGVDDVRGYDQPEIDRTRLLIPDDRFVATDLGAPVSIDRRFDLALCLEVAEHLPPHFSESLVDELVALAPVIAFSAGVPGQGGDGHINERWNSWWDDRFMARGLERFDVLRHRLWREPGVQWWYAQNMVVYAPADHPSAPALRAEHHAFPSDVVHPGLFEDAMARRPTLRELVRALPGAARTSWKARVTDRLNSRR